MKTRIVMLALVLMFGQNVFAAGAVRTVVDPDNLDGWSSLNQAGSASVIIGTTQGYGLGSGSLEYLGMDSADDRAEAGRVLVGKLSDISGIGYSYHSDSSAAAALKIEYWSLSHFGTLNWEPANNSGTTGAWVDTGNTAAGNWWTTESLNGGTEGGQLDQRTLAAWVTELGDPGTTLLRIGAGSGWSSPVTTYADLVWVERTAGEDFFWDFETQAPTPLPPPMKESAPVPTAGTWALIIMTLGLAFVGFRRIRKTA